MKVFISQPMTGLTEEEILSIRKQARDNKDWAKSDEIRDKLLAHKIQLKDAKDGTTWQII